MPDILLSRTQILAVDFLERCVRDLEPLAAVTGAAGTGKTVALNTALARRESAGDRVIRVNNFVAGPLSLHRVLAAALGVAEAAELSAQELEPVLRRALAEAGQAESPGLVAPPLLAVDDAQSLLPETLRYLCLLAGLREAGRPLLRIVLVGRPGFTVRQPIPLQFTLEPMRPEATREVIEHGLAAAGVSATEPVVQDLVARAQGNLRKLNGLLRESVQEAGSQGGRKNGVLKTASRRPVASQSARGSAEGRSRSRRSTSRRAAAWLAAPALVALAIGGSGIAYHDGWLGGLSPAPIVTAPAAPVGAKPSQTTSQAPPEPDQVAAASPPSGSATRAQPNSNPGPRPAAVPATTEPVAPPAAQPPAAQPSAAQPSPAQSAVNTPVVAPPVVAEAAPVAPAASVSLRPGGASGPATDGASQSPARSPTAASGRFRVYNISSCHRGVCARWAVTDLDRQQRLVAGFDPASLHLDHETLQELRAGTVDLIVKGAVARSGSEGATLDAVSLEAVAPHRGRPRPAATTQADEPAIPSPEMSPQPGYLALPGAGSSPFGPGQAADPPDDHSSLGQQASPYQQGGQY